MEKRLKARIFDIEEGRLEVILNDEDAKDLGIHPRDRIEVFAEHKKVVAIVNTTKTVVGVGEIGVLAEVSKACDIKGGDLVSVTPTGKPKSIEYIRKKMRGIALEEAEFEAIIKDVVGNNLSEIELTAFVSALYINEMNMDETTYLTKKIAESGEMLDLKKKPIFDKHSIGGVPGNKITLLIVPIVASAGLTIPKTSSRAITSACGTADIMEVLAPVVFNAREIEGIVNKTNGIIAWGGGVNLAPADDIFIQVEYPLAIDPHNLALCSVMAKKLAVGANFVVIDIPMGEGTKACTMKEAKRFARDFVELGERLGIGVECAITYGDKPIGRAIGPALEAREALRALEGKGPSSLIEKATDIAGIILEAGGVADKGKGKEAAQEYLNSGKALAKMKEIIKAQGGNPDITAEDIKIGEFSEKIFSAGSGYVTHISNKAIVQIARAAGAPKDKGAGILLHITKGRKIEKGELLFEIFAESEYKLKCAAELAKQLPPIGLEGMLLKRIPEFVYFEY
jgi:AMP phosphorylase